MEKKVDRRIRRSKKLLKHSLIDLLDEKNFNDITITDLVTASDLNRSTFYAHFRDKEELLTSLIDELLDGMIESMSVTSDSHSASYHPSPYVITQHSTLQLFTYLSEHSSVFKTLMNYNKVPNFTYRLSEALYQFYFTKIKEEPSSSQKWNMNRGFFANYIASIIVGFINHWLIHTNNKYHPAYIATEFNKIFIANTDFSYIQPIQS